MKNTNNQITKGISPTIISFRGAVLLAGLTGCIGFWLTVGLIVKELLNI